MDSGFQNCPKLDRFLIRIRIANHNYKSKLDLFSPEIPKARTNKTGFNIMIVHFYIRRKLDIIQYMIFQYDLEPFLIQRILIGFEAILENYVRFVYLLCIWYIVWTNCHKSVFSWSPYVNFFPVGIKTNNLDRYIITISRMANRYRNAVEIGRWYPPQK